MGHTGRERTPVTPPTLRLALVNLMPDAAFRATERQFTGLVEGAARTLGRAVTVDLHTMVGDPRGSRMAEEVRSRYLIWDAGAAEAYDGVIVTGANPVRNALADEPFWAELTGLFDWAGQGAHGLMLSCLSAHAGLLHFDGIARRRLAHKVTGVFDQDPPQNHPLVAGLDRNSLVPHSRWNDVGIDELARAGWEVALSGPQCGWTAATKEIGRCEVTVLQGHPEYDATSLLAEYQRDARRFSEGEQDALPPLPHHVLGDVDAPELTALQAAFAAGERAREEFLALDGPALEARASAPWASTAAKLYENWLAQVARRSVHNHAG